MEIKNSFEIPLPLDEAWRTLLDIEKVTPCMPGATLIEVIDPQTYKGEVRIRLGPVALAFVGTARMEDVDPTAHRARLKGQGLDSKGRGGANGVVTFTLSPCEGGTKVDVDTTVNLSGSVAQYGRSTGIIQDVATQIIGQFAAALRTMLARETMEQAALTASEHIAEHPLSPAAKPISGLALVANLLWNSLRRLFGKRR
jgi:hypothetical protein